MGVGVAYGIYPHLALPLVHVGTLRLTTTAYPLRVRRNRFISFSELCFYQTGHFAHVGTSGQLGLDHAHHFAHVLRSGCAR